MAYPTISCLAMTASFYVVPRILTYTAKKYTEKYGDIPMTIEARKQIKNIMSAAADNFFLAYFIFQYISDLRGTRIFAVKGLPAVSGGMAVTCIALHVLRISTCKNYPSMTKYIGPSYLDVD